MYYIAISIHGLNIIFKVKKIKMEKLKRGSISPLLEKQKLLGPVGWLNR